MENFKPEAETTGGSVQEMIDGIDENLLNAPIDELLEPYQGKLVAGYLEVAKQQIKAARQLTEQDRDDEKLHKMTQGYACNTIRAILKMMDREMKK